MTLKWPFHWNSRPFFRQDRIFYQDRIFSRTVYFTSQDCIFYYLIKNRSIVVGVNEVLTIVLQKRAACVKHQFKLVNSLHFSLLKTLHRITFDIYQVPLFMSVYIGWIPWILNFWYWSSNLPFRSEIIIRVNAGIFRGPKISPNSPLIWFSWFSNLALSWNFQQNSWNSYLGCIPGFFKNLKYHGINPKYDFDDFWLINQA